MAMAMRLPAIARAATEMAAAPVGLRRLFCSNATKFSFLSPQSNPETPARPQADPSTNLFVSGLSKRTTSEGLRTAFAQFGEVADAKVVTDRVSGYSKGFGFVRYATLEDSAKGIAGMDGKFLDGWVIFAEYARPREPSQTYQPQNNMSRPPYGDILDGRFDLQEVNEVAALAYKCISRAPRKRPNMRDTVQVLTRVVKVRHIRKRQKNSPSPSPPPPPAVELGGEQTGNRSFRSEHHRRDNSMDSTLEEC